MQISAVVFAGGSGKRMKINSIPKQFMEVNDKPIIVYTLEHFQNHPQIDNIVVVCIEGWIEHMERLVHKFQLTKVKWIVKGGKTGQESIWNGLNTIFQNTTNSEETIVLIHDGVRPLINEKVITDNIVTVQQYKTAITVTPAIETIMMINEQNGEVLKTADRKSCMLARAPQSFYLSDIYEAHKKMQADGKYDMIDSATIMEKCGYKLTTVIGPVENVKITTPTDFYVFEALLKNKVEESDEFRKSE